MGEAYNAFDSLRSFIKRECGSSLTDSLLERGNYVMNLSLRAWGKSFKLRGYCWEFFPLFPGGLCVWFCFCALVPVTLCVCMLCFFCFKFSLFTFVLNFYFGCARSSNLVAFSCFYLLFPFFIPF